MNPAMWRKIMDLPEEAGMLERKAGKSGSKEDAAGV